MLRWLTAGESHGRRWSACSRAARRGRASLTADIAAALARRRLGYGRGARMKFEQTRCRSSAASGTGCTLGGPVAIEIGNTEWPKWETVMSADPVDADVLAGAGAQRAADPAAARPRRPSRHAEVRLRRRPPGAGARQRPRDRGPGRARARSPGRSCGRRSASRWSRHVVAIGAVARPDGAAARGPTDVAALDADPVRCLDAAAERGDDRRDRGRHEGRRHARRGGRGGRLRPAARPGHHVHWDRRLDARLAGALMGIQAIKGVEVGDGFEHRPPPRRRRPTTRSSCDGEGGLRRRTEPRGRPRGRHDQRRAAAGAGRDEADLDRAAGPGHRRRGHRRGRRARSTSAPTCARCRPPGWSPRPWWRWCWPTRRWRSSAATRVPRPAATSTATCDSAGRAAATGPVTRAGSVRTAGGSMTTDRGWSECPAAGKSTIGRRLAKASDVPSSTPTPRVETHRADHRRHLRRRRRAGVPGARGEAVAHGARRAPGASCSLGGGAITSPRCARQRWPGTPWCFWKSVTRRTPRAAPAWTRSGRCWSATRAASDRS